VWPKHHQGSRDGGAPEVDPDEKSLSIEQEPCIRGLSSHSSGADFEPSYV
jgi:hypothetical protein